jgi:integrase
MRASAADLGDALASPKPVKHRPSLKPGELPEFMRRLARYDGDERTRLGLELVAHTAVRTSEARFAHRDEFEDLDSPQALWRIPAARMKMRRDHLVPLSPRAAEIVNRLLKLTGKKALPGGRRGARPVAPGSNASPTERPHILERVPRLVRSTFQGLRKALLYPAELPGRAK